MTNVHDVVEAKASNFKAVAQLKETKRSYGMEVRRCINLECVHPSPYQNWMYVDHRKTSSGLEIGAEVNCRAP